MDSSEVKEGFICPVCMKNLYSVTELQSHFSSSHQDEDNFKQTLKDCIGKAKQRIKQELSTAPVPQQPLYKYRPDSVKQSIGVTTSHWALFKTIRDERVDHLSTETNKLIIRLDKLLTKLPSDPVKRKAHEKSIVAWVEDESISLCPECGLRFGLTRRKHHCRLCGFVMCGRCSTFISLSRGQKLAPPTRPPVSLLPPPAPEPGRAAGPAPGLGARLGLSLSPLRRSGSVGSLNSMVSVVDAVTGEQQLRICKHCDQKLLHREEQLEQQNSEPIIAQFYNQMRDMQKEIRDLIPMHNKMLESLLAGESKYHLSDANSLRIKILTTAERVDAMSKRISQLGGDAESVSPWQRQLQSRLRSAATAFLKEEVISLPQLPTEQQLKELQVRLRQETESRLAEEREYLARESQRRQAEETSKLKRWSSLAPRPSQSQPAEKGREQVSYWDGWSPPAGPAPEADDPLLQQMAIVRGYIRQARQSHKYDELAMFEQNLRDLQGEYERRAGEGGA